MKKTGRNDPCPCGSGKKYKQCCADAASSSTPAAEIQENAPRPVHDLVQEGLDHHLAGRLPQAEAIYRQILAVTPNHPDALHLLGMIAHQAGQNDAAVELINKAIAVNPTGAMYCNLGNVLKVQGKLAEAVQRYRSALALVPAYFDAHLNLGLALQDMGNFDGAIESYRNALALQSDSAKAHYNLGLVLHVKGDLASAAVHYMQALGSAPAFAEAHNNLGLIRQTQGKFDAAIDHYRKALASRPEFAEAENNLGNAFEGHGKLDAALEHYQRALAFRPNFAEAHYNLANALRKKNILTDAITHYRTAIALAPQYIDAYINLGSALQEAGQTEDAAACFRQVLAWKPDHADAHNNLGNLCMAAGDYASALDHYQKAATLAPHAPDVYVNLGKALKEQGHLQEAAACCRQAIALRPGHAEALHSLGVILHNQGLLSEALACFDRAITLKPGYAEAHNCRGVTLQSCGKLDDSIQSFRKASALAPLDMKAESNLLFCHNYHPALAPEEIFAAYRAWNDKHACKQDAHAPFANSPDPERRIRIGYVSPDFRNHSVIHFAAPLIEAHDRSGFEVSCYYNHSAKDAYTERLIASADHWVQCGKMSDEELAQRIRSDGIDILVDLAGHSAGNRLQVFALKPAPVQATWMGYGYTTGMDVMDYFIGDHAFTPQGCDHLFSERIWRLPHTFATYLPPATPEPAPSPALRRGYVTFACLSRSERINDRMIAAWAEILRAVPDARLRLDSRNFNDKAMRDDFASRFARFDISPSRLETGFTSPVWQVYNEVDIVLDCFPHNSGATTYEALWMGNPVVTLAGRPSVGRLGSSVLSCLGRTEWIATDVSEYVACAVSLASNLQDLARIRSSLRGDMLASRLLDRTAFARDMEAAYRGMWKDWCAKRD